jgi:hypothetical protein
MDRTLARSNSRVTTSGLLGQVASASASVGEVTRRVIDLDRGDLANSGKVGRGSQTSGQRGEVPAITCGRNIGEYRIANLKGGDGSHNVCKAHLFSSFVPAFILAATTIIHQWLRELGSNQH